MTKQLMVGLLTFHISCATLDAAKAPVPLRLDVAVELAGTEDKYLLRVKVTNREEVPITLYKHSLPWNWHYGMLVVPVAADLFGTVLLNEERPIDDPVPERIIMKPSETLTGEVDLEEWSSSLRETLKKKDVLVLWSYEPMTADDTAVERVSGVVTIPRVGK